MNYLRNHLAFIVIVALAIIVLALAGLILVFSMTDKSGPQVNDQETPIVTQKDLPVTQVPEKFPVNVPIEEGATILQNYNATAADGRFQATRTFETKKSLDANFTIYENYLKANNWKIETTLNQPEYKLLVGTNGNTQLQISLSENTVDKVKTVDISLTELNLPVGTGDQ